MKIALWGGHNNEEGVRLNFERILSGFGLLFTILCAK